MDNSSVLRKNPNMVTRVIDDETILLPIFKHSDEINCIYSLNKAASMVWKMINGRNTYAKIREQILRNFDSDPGEMNKELKRLVKDLADIKALV